MEQEDRRRGDRPFLKNIEKESLTTPGLVYYRKKEGNF
jgi:hypothetical protein